MLELNKIYKVKEGHEGKCTRYNLCDGKYIIITAIGESLHYHILDMKTERLMMCNCFTEDDLEEEEHEHTKFIPDGDTFKCAECGVKGIKFNLEEEEVKEKSLEDLEERLLPIEGQDTEILKLINQLYSLPYGEQIYSERINFLVNKLQNKFDITPPKETVKEIEKLEPVLEMNGITYIPPSNTQIKDKINELIEEINTLKANNK